MQHSRHYKENDDIQYHRKHLNRCSTVGTAKKTMTLWASRNNENDTTSKKCRKTNLLTPSIKSEPTISRKPAPRRPLGATVCDQCLHPRPRPEAVGGSEAAEGATVSEQCLHPHGESGGPTAERPQRRQPAGATVCEQCLHPRQQSRQPANHRSAAKWVQKVGTARMLQWGTRNTKCTESCDKKGTEAETAMGSITMRQDMNGGRVTSSHEMKMTMRQHEAKRNGQRARVGTRVKVRIVHKANTRKLAPMQQKNRVPS